MRPYDKSVIWKKQNLQMVLFGCHWEKKFVTLCAWHSPHGTNYWGSMYNLNEITHREQYGLDIKQVISGNRKCFIIIQ